MKPIKMKSLLTEEKNKLWANCQANLKGWTAIQQILSTRYDATQSIMNKEKNPSTKKDLQKQLEQINVLISKFTNLISDDAYTVKMLERK